MPLYDEKQKAQVNIPPAFSKVPVPERSGMQYEMGENFLQAYAQFENFKQKVNAGHKPTAKEYENAKKWRRAVLVHADRYAPMYSEVPDATPDDIAQMAASEIVARRKHEDDAARMAYVSGGAEYDPVPEMLLPQKLGVGAALGGLTFLARKPLVAGAKGAYGLGRGALRKAGESVESAIGKKAAAAMSDPAAGAAMKKAVKNVKAAKASRPLSAMEEMERSAAGVGPESMESWRRMNDSYGPVPRWDEYAMPRPQIAGLLPDKSGEMTAQQAQEWLKKVIADRAAQGLPSPMQMGGAPIQMGGQGHPLSLIDDLLYRPPTNPGRAAFGNHLDAPMTVVPQYLEKQLSKSELEALKRALNSRRTDVTDWWQP